MAIKINEQRMVDQNAFLYEERLKSPIRRFIDKTFVNAKYWNIKSTDTTVDKGFGDVGEILGKDSPIRYSKIDNLPIYGLDQIILQLDNQEQGLDSSFESECVIMADTITPYQNDFFMIQHLKESYIFRVTQVGYDNLASKTAYKVNFVLEYIDNTKVDDLDRQTVSEFTCVLENIGTSERAVIEKPLKEKIDKIDAMYDEIVQIYISLFYNERYNCLLAEFENIYKLYDPLLEQFITQHRLFTAKNQIDGLVLNLPFGDMKRKLKYERSIYRCIETRDVRRLSNFKYTTFPGVNNVQTPFYRWLDDTVMIADIKEDMNPLNIHEIFTDEMTDIIKMNGFCDDPVINLLKRFIRNEEVDLADIDIDIVGYILGYTNANLQLFFFIPLVLYIIKYVVNLELKKTFTE